MLHLLWVVVMTTSELMTRVLLDFLFSFISITFNTFGISHAKVWISIFSFSNIVSWSLFTWPFSHHVILSCAASVHVLFSLVPFSRELNAVSDCCHYENAWVVSEAPILLADSCSMMWSGTLYNYKMVPALNVFSFFVFRKHYMLKIQHATTCSGLQGQIPREGLAHD